MKTITMEHAFEQLLMDHHNIVLLGEAGSGKSEIALNIARRLAQGGRPVDFFDLDQVKPLFRSRDAFPGLADSGIDFHFERQLLDAPTIVGGVPESLARGERYTVLDLGGDHLGARMIGRFARLLDSPDTLALYVVNPYRPWSRDVEAIDITLSAISRVSRLRNFHIAANPNLGAQTTAEDFISGVLAVERMLAPHLPIAAAFAEEELCGQVKNAVDIPVLPLHLYLKYEWEEEERPRCLK